MNKLNEPFWIIDYIENICFFIDRYFTCEFKIADYVYLRNFYKL